MTPPVTGQIHTHPTHETIIEVRDLVKRYGSVLAVDHLNIDIRRGEIYALLGPNGSGKSTTINCILSLLRYNNGTIRILGETMKPDRYDIKRRVGLVPQMISVFDELTVEQNIDFFCGLYTNDRALKKQRIEEAIQFTGLTDHRTFLPDKLSGGLKRRLNIACGMAHEPDILILDEPTVAVDPQSRFKILQGVQELNQRGVTVIYTTHYMEEVEELADRVGIMDQGKMIAEGTLEEVKEMIDLTEIIRVELIHPDDQLAVDLIGRQDGVISCVLDEQTLVIELGRTQLTLLDILRLLETHEIRYGQVYGARPTLNNVFLEITGKALRDQ